MQITKRKLQYIHYTATQGQPCPRLLRDSHQNNQHSQETNRKISNQDNTDSITCLCKKKLPFQKLFKCLENVWKDTDQRVNTGQAKGQDRGGRTDKGEFFFQKSLDLNCYNKHVFIQDFISLNYFKTIKNCSINNFQNFTAYYFM